MSFIVFIAFSYTDKGISLGAKADSNGEEYFLTLAPRLKFFIEAVNAVPMVFSNFLYPLNNSLNAFFLTALFLLFINDE